MAIRMEKIIKNLKLKIAAIGCHGFTVIELIMVILIVSILAVVLIPKIGGIHSFKLDGAGQKLVSDIKYAQKLAMSKHQIHGILFEPAQEKYTVYQDGADTPVEDPHRPGSSLIVDYDDEHFEGVDLYSANFTGGNEVRFDCFGTPSDASDTPLTVTGEVVLKCSGEQISIQVTPNTGKTEMVK
ncbi:MAG: type II secretion system protein [bacterium]|nr:type II secretion system protein [bacterium]